MHFLNCRTIAFMHRNSAYMYVHNAHIRFFDLLRLVRNDEVEHSGLRSHACTRVPSYPVFGDALSVVTSTMCLDEVDRVIVCRLDGQVSEHQMKSQASGDYYRAT